MCNMYQSSPHLKSSDVEQCYYMTRRRRRVSMCKVKLWVLLGTARVSVSPFDVSVSPTGSITSNGGMRREVCSRYCVGRRPIQFKPELFYFDFREITRFFFRFETRMRNCWIRKWIQFIFLQDLFIKYYSKQVVSYLLQPTYLWVCCLLLLPLKYAGYVSFTCPNFCN
jgi:hypothetical protein